LLLNLSKKKKNAKEREEHGGRREKPLQEPHPNITTARTPPNHHHHPTTTTATTTHPQLNFQPLPKIKRKTDWEGEKEKNQRGERKLIATCFLSLPELVHIKTHNN
jgi:hypothetical protein